MKNVKKLNWKPAFTLAEVLITLAIIGVVAALTVPTVITNYKNKALETQKKKALSILSNGFKLLMANEGVSSMKYTDVWECEDDKECIAGAIKKTFNVVSDNTSSNDIFNTEYHFASDSKPVWSDPVFHYVFVTSDGMIFGLRQEEDRILITTDVNGIKNPNKGAQDLCSYAITDTGSIKDYCADMANWTGTPEPEPEPEEPDNGCSYTNISVCTEAQCNAIAAEYPWVYWGGISCIVPDSK